MSNAPARSIASAAASARIPRRPGSAVNAVACSRNAAAAARPPRACARPAERSSSSATDSSGPSAAWARCHARRSGSQLRIDRAGERPMDVPSVRRGRGPVGG